MKILIVAYHFPPSIEVGARRPSGIQKHLSKRGWETFILSENPAKYENSSVPGLDAGNTKEKRIHTTELVAGVISIIKKIVPFRSEILGFIGKMFFIPDVHLGWAIRSVIAGRKLIIKNKIEIVYSTSPPQSVNLVGLLLKIIFPNLVWICDFRDLWTLDRGYKLSLQHYPLRRAIDASIERKAISNADKFVVTSEGSRKEFSTRYDKPMEVVYNGYDKEYYSDANRDMTRKDCLRILYCGSLYSGIRDPSVFIEVLENVIDQKHIRSDKVKVEFYVREYDQKILFRIKEKMKYPDIMEINKTVPYEKMVSIQYNVDCHLVLNRDIPNEIGPIPAKIFEFIATGLPIIVWDREDSMREDRKYLELYEGLLIATKRDKLFRDLIQLCHAWTDGENVSYSTKTDFSQEYMAQKFEKIMLDAYDNRLRS